MKDNEIRVNVKGGYLRAITSPDPLYPGIWVEFIRDNEPVDELSRPTILFEQPAEGNYQPGEARLLIWDDPEDEDYTREIEFRNKTEIYQEYVNTRLINSSSLTTDKYDRINDPLLQHAVNQWKQENCWFIDVEGEKQMLHGAELSQYNYGIGGLHSYTEAKHIFDNFEKLFNYTATDFKPLAIYIGIQIKTTPIKNVHETWVDEEE